MTYLDSRHCKMPALDKKLFISYALQLSNESSLNTPFLHKRKQSTFLSLNFRLGNQENDVFFFQLTGIETIALLCLASRVEGEQRRVEIFNFSPIRISFYRIMNCIFFGPTGLRIFPTFNIHSILLIFGI